MSSYLSDHVRRDAEDAARALIRISIGRYRRRMDELAKGAIKEALERATQEGRAIDGHEIGRAAAEQAIAAYIGSGAPQPAIEAPADKRDG